jgi:ABC-type dipeptide/oligopeptide/nickel transport system permease subunit
MIRFIIAFLVVYFYISMSSAVALCFGVIRGKLDCSFTEILTVCLFWPFFLWRGYDD